MSRFTVVFVAVASVLFSSANAAEGLYLGANYTDVAYKEDGIKTVYPGALTVKAGYGINKNFAVEGRLGTGIVDDEIKFSGVTVNVDVDNYYGAYAKAIAPLSKVVSIYGLAGYTHGKLTASVGGLSVSESDGDVSFGFGGDFNIRDILSINVEWAKLFKGDGYEVNALSLGVSKNF